VAGSWFVPLARIRYFYEFLNPSYPILSYPNAGHIKENPPKRVVQVGGFIFIGQACQPLFSRVPFSILWVLVSRSGLNYL